MARRHAKRDVPGLPGLRTGPTEEERRIARLRERKAELESLAAALDQRAADEDEIEWLRREIAGLEAELKGRRETEKRSDGMDPIRQLETIEKAVADAAAEPARLRKSAEDLYDDVVERIARSEGCSMSRAHGLAAKDPVAKRAYSLVLECQDRERAAREGASRIGAYLG